MSLLKKPERRCTDGFGVFDRKTKGSGGVYIISLIVMIFFVLLLKWMLDKERLYVTYDTVDDAIVSSLIAASPVNLREYGRSGQLVIYDDVTQDIQVGLGTPVLTDEQRATMLLDSVDLLSPVTDSYLNNAYNIFMTSLRQNLKLDASMNATISGIDGVVDITDFCVFNKFEYYTSTGDLLHYRFVQYTYRAGAWSAYAYPIDTPVEVYNSFGKMNTTLDSTSIMANLSFRLNLTENEGLIEYTAQRDVTYQRIVDVTD